MSEIYTKERLAELQAMSLDEKIEITKDRIEDWYMQFSGNVYVSFSGGQDSTVLLHLVREMFPEVPAVFCDTGLEYPEVRQHVREMKNVVILRPKMTFPEVIKTYGYPMVSKEVAEAIYYARRTTKKNQHQTDNAGYQGKYLRGVIDGTSGEADAMRSVRVTQRDKLCGRYVWGGYCERQSGDASTCSDTKAKTGRTHRAPLRGGIPKADITRKNGSNWLFMPRSESVTTAAA